MVTKIDTFLILLLILSIAACQNNKTAGPEKIPGEEDLREFDATIDAIMNDLDVEYYSYAILTNTKIIERKENGITPDQIVSVGDLSNLLLSTLLLQYIEKEKIDINDRISEYGINGNYGNARLKNLLSYTYNTTNRDIRYDPGNYRLISRVLKEVSGKELPQLFKSNLRNKLKLKQTILQNDGDHIMCQSSMDDLIRLSMAIDNRELFEDEYTHNLLFRPVYLETGERSPAGPGCFIDITDDKKLIWSAGQSPGYSTLFLKSPTDSISLILIARSPDMNSLFHLENGKIRNTPVYYAFRKIIHTNDSTDTGLNFYNDYQTIRSSVQKLIRSENRDIACDEISAYLVMYNKTGNKEKSDSLGRLYKELFPRDIPPEKLTEQPVAEINKVMDYMQLNRTFTLGQETKVTIFATAEYTKEMSLSPWEYDNVEMFFDLNHERGPGFNSGADDRQYRFNYDFPDITGNAPTFDSITLIQYDVSPNRFNFEIAIPWTILFNSDSVNPESRQIMGFDIAIADNDAEVREGSLAWQSKLNETPWSNTSTYGTMILVNSPGSPNDTTCYALLKSRDFILDGQNKGEWNNIPRYPIDKEYMEGITGPADQSGWFRAQWDKENLYFLAEVQDDVKRLLDKTGDFGWITTAEGDTVWIMTEANSVYAGGDLSNRYVKTTLPLQTGKYILHYQTNQTNSYGRWLRKRPDISFYGIVLY